MCTWIYVGTYIYRIEAFMQEIVPCLTGCNNEQAAAGVLGFNKVSWDNLSGQEKQPISSDKDWMALTQHEHTAAIALGYTKTTWDNMSGSEPQPASAGKAWSELTSCGTSKMYCLWDFVWFPLRACRDSRT